MTSTPKTDVRSGLQDPRRRSDFLPQHYPRANGKEAPPIDAAGQNDRIVLEFLAVYYELNCEYCRLLELRKRPDSQQRSEAERERLQAIEKALVLRDGLEDRRRPAQPTVCRGRRRSGTAELGSLSHPPVHSYDWHAALLCRGWVLAVKERSPGRW